uniref:Cytochrome c oxidase assembly factor 5 n=1 Tax=Parascaris univalens TaxID=6257 RepID=A0A915AI76_PARUN
MPSGPNVQKNKIDGASCNAKGSGSNGSGAGGGSIRTDLNRNITAQPVVKVKCVVVGDAGVGKTTMIKTATGCSSHLTDYEPTVIDVYGSQLSHPLAYPHFMEVYDSAGKEEYDRLRQLTYVGVHVIVICYSVGCRNSFRNAESRWADEIKLGLCPENVPIILAATKIDIRNDPKTIEQLARQLYSEDQLELFKLVTKDEGEAMARKIGAYSFVECTFHDKSSVLRVFLEALCAALEARNAKNNEQTTAERANLLKKLKGKTHHLSGDYRGNHYLSVFFAHSP